MFYYVKQNVRELKRMTVLKRYVLRMFISLKYITTNVVDKNNGWIVQQHQQLNMPSRTH